MVILRRSLFVLAVIGVFVVLVGVVGGDGPLGFSTLFGDLTSPRAIGTVLLATAAVAVAIVCVVVAYRRRIGDASIGAMAGAVRLSRKAKAGIGSVRDKVVERADATEEPTGSPDRTPSGPAPH